MSIPGEEPDTQREQEVEKSTPSFADRVNEAVKTIKKDEKGNYVFPEDASDEFKFSVTAEIRRRDTQAEFTRTNQEARALKAEKAALLQKLHGDVTVALTDEQAEELEELKFSDPEAWRKKMNKLETEARNKRISEIDEELKQVSTGSLETEELERRKQVLTDFVAEHEGFELNDQVLANDIPPRITKKLETGAISFEAFLQECHDYLSKGKVVKQTDEGLGQPNLSKVGGGSRPDKNAMNEDYIRSYDKETY